MIVTIPKILSEKLGPDGADALAHLINEVESGSTADLATKGDLNIGLAQTKGELHKAIADSRTDLIKWMFLFWIGQIAAVLTILSFLRK